MILSASWVLPLGVLGGLVCAAYLFVWCARDYRAWVSLGAGGLPHNLGGWLAMSLLRLLKRDPRAAEALRPVLNRGDDEVYLGVLMRRSGARPIVPPHPIPQRQLDALPAPGVMQQLQALFDRQVDARPAVLTWARSAYEKHNPAVVLRDPACGWCQAARWRGEVAHVHPADGSMHMILSPSDAAEVVEKGWGELHTLSGRLGLLPPSYTFVYAPRTHDDLVCIERILQAAIAHMSRSEPAGASPRPGARRAP